MKSNEINKNNAWYQLGRLVGTNITDSELDIFLKKNNLYATINASSNSSFKQGTFEKIINILDEKGIDTSDINSLYLEWSNVENSNIKGYDRYSFYWGYDVEKLNQKEFISFAEASELWGLGESTLRSVVRTNRLVEGVDYRKSGKVWLITKNAMEKLYGERVVSMENLAGRTWGDLSETQKAELLNKANAINGVDGTRAKEGDCIVDFEGFEVSISGRVIAGEYENTIEIDNSAKFYDPSN